MSIKNNTTSLQEVLNAVNALPEAKDDPVLQDKSVIPTTNQQTITADSGYDGLDTVVVESIPSNYITTDDATATSGDILGGKTAYVDGEMVIGEIDTKTSSDLTISGATVTVPAGYYASTALKSVSTATQATPNITVNSSGLITATATQSAGYVFSGTKSATKQLTTQGAQTITPTTTNQTISSGKYLTGTQTVKGDANLIAANIAEGKTIFGVTGTYTGGVDTSDATATADKIFLDETAYVNGEKVTGSFTIDDELTAQDSLITQIASTLVGNKAVSSSGTCTVIIAGFTGWNSSNNDVIRYSCVKNGEIVVEEIDMIPIFPDDVPYTFLENVVCNSIIEYRYDGDSDEVNYLDIVADDSITIFYQKIDTEVHVLFSASANGTIRFDEWD